MNAYQLLAKEREVAAQHSEVYVHLAAAKVAARDLPEVSENIRRAMIALEYTNSKHPTRRG